MIELFKNKQKKESCSVKLDTKGIRFTSYVRADIKDRTLGKWRKSEFQGVIHTKKGRIKKITCINLETQDEN